jgi:hypothetical protein
LLQLGLAAALLQFVSWATTYTFVPLAAHNLGASGTVLRLLTTGSLVAYTLAALGIARSADPRTGFRWALAGLLFTAVVTVSVPSVQSLALLGLT